jgi:hypothetical protein
MSVYHPTLTGDADRTVSGFSASDSLKEKAFVHPGTNERCAEFIASQGRWPK